MTMCQSEFYVLTNKVRLYTYIHILKMGEKSASLII